MPFRGLAIGVAIVLTVLSMPATVVRGQGATPDLKKTLFDVANSMGMLRFAEQRDAVRTLELWATGTMNVAGQAFKLPQYRASFNYHDHVRGMRADFTRVGADGKPQRQVQVVSGQFAWDETAPGMNATPAPGTLRERLIRYYSNPQPLVKAAVLAGAKTGISVEGGKTVLTFPLPAPADSMTAKVTLSAHEGMFVSWYEFAKQQERQVPEKLVPYPPLKGLVGLYPERVEVRDGDAVTETTFSEYGDWNDDDLKADVFIPRRLVQRRGGVTLLDLTVTRTKTNSPYVIIPVPANVKAAATAQ